MSEPEAYNNILSNYLEQTEKIRLMFLRHKEELMSLVHKIGGITDIYETRKKELANLINIEYRKADVIFRDLVSLLHEEPILT